MASRPGNCRAVLVTAFFLKCCGFWPADSKFKRKVQDVLVIYTISAIIAALAFTVLDLMKCIEGHMLDRFIYSTMNLLAGIFGLTKVVAMAMKRQMFFDLVIYSKKHFLDVEYDEYGTYVMKKCMFQFTGIVIFSIIICHMTMIIHYVRPLIVDRGKNATDRTFPFTLYSDLPITETPWYEILYIGEIITTYSCCYAYFCFDNFLCEMNITAVGQFERLHKEMREMCHDENDAALTMEEVRPKFVKCVQRHQQLIAFIENLKETYRVVILGVVILLSLLICLELFHLMTSKDNTALTTFHYCVYVGGSIMQLFFYTLTCDSLTWASMSIAYAAYDARWFIVASGDRKNALIKDLAMVILRSQRACSLTVGGFSTVTLQTFTSVCHTAFSFLALVRQTFE